MKRIVFGVSGASGWLMAAAVLEFMAECPGLETHLVVSEAAKQVAREECGLGPESLGRLASAIYDAGDFSAPPASGSWPNSGMVVCPCSLNTLGAVAAGLSCNLIQRGAAVALKERRPLILCVRETPLSGVTLANMGVAFSAGATIMPFIPAFYAGFDLRRALRHFTGHILDFLGVDNCLRTRWKDAPSIEV